MAAGNQTIIVRGCNDVASAVVHRLFGAGFRVAIHDDPAPAHTRRGMAFTDAIFDRKSELDGLWAKHQAELPSLSRMLACGRAIPVATGSFDELVQEVRPGTVVDARMRKRATSAPLSGSALVVGLGPNFVAGGNADLAVETAWGSELGRVIERGATRPLEGEPREIDGHARDRYVYSPESGLFLTSLEIGAQVEQGQEIARVAQQALTAPLTGRLRGLTHSRVHVERGTKVIEVDPRGEDADIYGIGERPRRIAEGVLEAVSRLPRH